MKDIIVTGGRDYQDYNMVRDVLDFFDINHIIQGGANGADRLAREYSEDRPTTTLITFDADWDTHGRAAGPIRNREMLKAYQDAIVIAFPGGKGTEDCVKAAQALNMVVLRVVK